MKRTVLALIVTLAVAFSVVTVILLIHLGAQTYSAATIRSDGGIEGTNLIQRQGDTYTLTGDLSAGIHVQRSDIVIDGAGYAVKGGDSNGIGISLSNKVPVDSSRAQIKNVTVKNLKLTNCSFAIDFFPSVNDTFIDNHLVDCYIGFNIWRTHNHTLMHNTIENCVTGITISFGGSGNVITGNNIINSSVFVMEQSPNNTVDRNYWSDYPDKYPNATEIGITGIWNTPYEGHESFTDNHPLVEPVAVNPALGGEPFPTILVIAAAVSLVVVCTGLLVYFKRRKREAAS